MVVLTKIYKNFIALGSFKTVAERSRRELEITGFRHFSFLGLPLAFPFQLRCLLFWQESLDLIEW